MVGDNSAPLVPDTADQSEAPVKGNTLLSMGLAALLLLTFFSPLGSVLFLPIVLIGVCMAFWQVRHTAAKGQQLSETDKANRGLALSFFKALIIAGTILVVGFLSIIGFFFVVFSSNGGRMGS